MYYDGLYYLYEHLSMPVLSSAGHLVFRKPCGVPVYVNLFQVSSDDCYMKNKETILL